MSCVWRLDHVDLTDTAAGYGPGRSAHAGSPTLVGAARFCTLDGGRRHPIPGARWSHGMGPDGGTWGWGVFHDLWRVVELISCFNLLCDVFGFQLMRNPHKSTNDWGIYAGEYSFFFFGRAIWSKFKDPTWTATVKVTVRWMWRMLTFEQVGPLGWRNFEAWAVLR